MVCSQTSSRTLVIFVQELPQQSVIIFSSNYQEKISEDAEMQLPTQIVLSLYLTTFSYFSRVLKTFVYH